MLWEYQTREIYLDAKKKRENSTKPMHNNTSNNTGVISTYVQKIRANSNFSIKVPSPI
ncbi:hypothetical protein RintRC_4830 [Richelia intracellularis]|nr:hypothetical protein RintRC_4830 [Richelia intracellularis]